MGLGRRSWQYYQTKNVLITPSATSKYVVIRSHSYAPSLRGFRVDNTATNA